ncbi:MAG: hypothetical protein IT385_03890 [Deltaproteobacteria bacterium]|nr:hypothetical protein [Deltaproteobacteria bacterium]
MTRALVRLLFALLAACITAAPEPSPEVAPAGSVEVRVLTPVPQGSELVLVLGAGADAGIAVGDRGRLACVDADLVVTEVFAKRAKAVLPEAALGGRPLPNKARVSLGGRPAVRFCPWQ